MVTKTSFVTSSPHHMPLKELFITYFPQSRAHGQLESPTLCQSDPSLPLTTYCLPYIRHPENAQPTYSP
jgi:hypothetical protein